MPEIRSVIVVNVSQVYGGQERYVEILAKALTMRGFEVRCEGGPSSLLDTVNDPKACSGVNQEKTSRVLVLNGNAALYRWWPRRREWRDAVVVYVQHSLWTDRQAGICRLVIRALLLTFFLQFVNAVIRVCKSSLPAAMVPSKRCTTVYNGVSLDDYPCRSEWSGSANLGLLMVGAVNDNKNQELAIRALARLPGLKLTIVGEGPARARLEALSVSTGVADRISWVGHEAEVAAYYRSADVLLVLSRFEAMPFVILESMASGTPVIAMPVGGIREMIDHQDNGILLKDRRVETLIQELEILKNSPYLVKEMGLKARRRVEREFTAAGMADGFVDVIANVERKSSGRFR